MKVSKPQVQLNKEVDAGTGATTYFVHVVTFTDRTNFRANGQTVGTVSTDGILSISVSAIQDITIPDFNYLTPIVHTIDLSGITFPGGEGIIEIAFDDGSRGGGSKTIVRTVDADEDSRPVKKMSFKEQ